MIVTVKRIRREEENTLKDLLRDNLLAITVYVCSVYRFKNVIVTYSSNCSINLFVF